MSHDKIYLLNKIELSDKNTARHFGRVALNEVADLIGIISRITAIPARLSLGYCKFFENLSEFSE